MMIYPFTAIVGQEKLKKALLLCAINPAIGGLLIQGDKGTAKSTAARALAEVVPQITSVKHCQFNCSVTDPGMICEICNQPEKTTHTVQVPFINLPLGATEERISGSLDLEAVLVEKKKKFQPGLLAAVHQGILYIDEVNLLPDHLVDILLDVSAMGENRIEREGLSLSHPSKFTLIGTMNPEEGQLRPQFLDRFGLMVHVEAPAEVTERTEVVRRRIDFENDKMAFCQRWALKQESLQQQLMEAKALLPSVQVQDDLLTLISELCTQSNVRSLRADIVIYKTAVTLAALALRTQVTEQDITAAAELALAHRTRRKSSAPAAYQPQDPSPQNESRQNPSGQNSQEQNPTPETQDKQSPDTSSDKNKTSSQKNTTSSEEKGDPSSFHHPGIGKENEAGGEKQQKADHQPAEEEKIFDAGHISVLPKLEDLVNRSAQPLQTGKRSAAENINRGTYLRAETAKKTTDIAIEATVINAVRRDPDHFAITIDDVQQKKRSGKTGNLILFVVDASGSMAARKRMEAVKGTVLNLLTEAYEKRDTVGVIAFRGIEAEVLLQPTQSIESAEEAMRTLPTGGRTPLPHALQMALQLLQNSGGHHKSYHPILVILTDGKANVGIPGSGEDPWSQTVQRCLELKAMNIQSLVLNSESNYFNLDKAEEMATLMGAQYISLTEISEEQLTPVISRISDR